MKKLSWPIDSPWARREVADGAGEVPGRGTDVHPQIEGFVPPTGSLTKSTGATAAVGKRLIDEASARFAEILGNAWQ